MGKKKVFGLLVGATAIASGVAAIRWRSKSKEEKAEYLEAACSKTWAKSEALMDKAADSKGVAQTALTYAASAMAGVTELLLRAAEREDPDSYDAGYSQRVETLSMAECEPDPSDTHEAIEDVDGLLEDCERSKGGN